MCQRYKQQKWGYFKVIFLLHLYLNSICILFTFVDELINQYEVYKVGAQTGVRRCAWKVHAGCMLRRQCHLRCHPEVRQLHSLASEANREQPCVPPCCHSLHAG